MKALVLTNKNEFKLVNSYKEEIDGTSDIYICSFYQDGTLASNLPENLIEKAYTIAKELGLEVSSFSKYGSKDGEKRSN